MELFFFANINCSWVMLRSLIKLFSIWSIGGMGEKGRCFWGCLCHVVIWNV